jgi:methanogenic corrinoid protein MtbC1
MATRRKASEITSTHPIQVVARRTGLTADVIRVWERRYHAVEPKRAKGKRRLYTDAEVERLLMLRKVTRAGRRIGDVARLSDKELCAMVAEDERAAAAAAEAAAPLRPRAGRHAPLFRECLRAIEALDAEALESALMRASVELSEPDLLDKLVFPLMDEIGERWHDGSLRVMHEHLSTGVLRTFLGSARGTRALPASAPVIVVATPAGHVHELGALAVALSASREGWRVVYLGPNIPAEEIAAAVKKSDARAVALSIVYPSDDPLVLDELRRLSKMLDDGVTVLAGGRGAPAYREGLEEIGATLPGSMADLRSMLEEIRLGL